LVDELADTLCISNDSAYRRIRGETLLTIQEAEKLCLKHGVSIDSFLGIKSNSVTFRYRSLNPLSFDFGAYLNNILLDLKRIDSYNQKEIIYMAKDIPLFYLFQFPALSSFKIFFWLKEFMQFPNYKNLKFKLSKENPFAEIGKQILEQYVRIPSVEIWNQETINSILGQINFLFESGIFENPQDALTLCDSIKELLAHVKEQAKQGKKLIKEKEVAVDEENYRLYYNDITLVDNTILINIDGSKEVYITHNLLNNLVTSNEAFCEETLQVTKNMMKKVNLISSTSEKVRNQFFLKLEDKVNALYKRIELQISE
jgi:hypothetical protein